MNLTNPVQKPPRLTDITYSTSHYEGNGSIINMGNVFGSPTNSSNAAYNNPDLINDTQRYGSGAELNNLGIDAASILPLSTATNNISAATNSLLASLSGTALIDPTDRPESGEYSRAGCDSLYPSGIWETPNLNSSLIFEQANDLYLKQTQNTTMSGYNNYSDKMPIIDNTTSNTMNLDDETSSVDYMSQSFPRTTINSHNNSIAQNNINNAISGYPSDYGLPLVPGAHLQTINNKFNPSPNSSPMTNGGIGIPLNAKTLRIVQKGGIGVLPPINQLKRALSSSRNSPDEGYQEGSGGGIGTDV
jgi:hypothetical protein